MFGKFQAGASNTSSERAHMKKAETWKGNGEWGRAGGERGKWGRAEGERGKWGRGHRWGITGEWGKSEEWGRAGREGGKK